MKVLQAVSLAVLPLLGTVLGCDKILGIDEKTFVAITGGGGGGGEGGGGGGEGGAGGSSTGAECTLAEAKNAAIRIMNAIPTSTVVDLCVKASSTSSYGEPWFKAQATHCGPGVAYSQYTTDLGIAAGTYDVKLVSSGDKCTATGVESPNVVIGENESITLLAYGESLRQASISPLKNRKAEGLNAALRFVHALNGINQLTAGIAAKRELPSSLSVPIFNDVTLGGVAGASTGGPLALDDVYDDGYSLYAGGESTRVNLTVGVTAAGSPDVTLVAPIPVTPGLAYSIFAIGLQGSVDWLPKIWSCNEAESDGLFLNCGNPVNVSFEVFNPNLADAFTSYVVERTPQATKSIVSEPADVLCVTELYDPKVKAAVKTLLPSPQFKYNAFSDDIDLDIHQNMPLMQSGDPAPYSPVACPGDMALLFADFLTCGRDATDPAGVDCTSVDSQGEHHLTNPGDRATACFANNCADKALTLMGSDLETGQGVSCYMCGLTHLASYETFESALAACTTENAAQPEHFAFGGTSGLGVLSVYPLGTPELVLLPSTGWLRAAMRVPVLLPNGTVIDHWCGSLRFPNAEVELPYAGRYGMDGSTDPGAIAEQKYEIKTLVDAVQSRHKQSGTRALVGLVTYSGPELKDDTGKTLVYGQQPDSYDALDAVWPRLVASNYTPACTYCGSATENPLNDTGATASFWTTHLFAEGLAPTQVQSTERTFKEARPVSINLATGTLKAPVSQHFGLRSVITITQ